MTREKFPNSSLPRLVINDAVNLQGVVLVAWRNRLLVLGTVIISIIICSLCLRTMQPTYTATLRLIPPMITSERSRNDLSGLASLAGIGGMSDDSITSFALYKESIGARQIADRISQDRHVLMEIFSSEWDEETQKWREPHSILGGLVASIRAMFGFPANHWQAPNGARLQAFIQKKVHIEEDRKQPIIILSFSHRDPKFAVLFLRTLHDAVNEELRWNALRRSDAYISYLTERLKTITIPDYREALIRSLVNQESFRMTASANLPFAADQLEPPVVSANPTGPNAGLSLAVAAFLGLIIGCALALLKATIMHRGQGRVQGGD